MNQLASFFRKFKILTTAALLWLAAHGPALAALDNPLADEGESTGSWTLPYMLVMMGIVLGMLVVCRSSNRRDKAKTEQFEEVTEKRVSQAELIEEAARKEKAEAEGNGE